MVLLATATRRRFATRAAQVGVDLVVLSSAFVLAHMLRFDFAVPPQRQWLMWAQLPLVLAVELAAMAVAGVYDLVWRYFALADLVAFIRAGFVFTAILLAGRLFAPADMGLLRVPLSIVVMNALLGIGGTVAVRVIRRAAFEHGERHQTDAARQHETRPVLLVGAGRAGVLAAKEIQGRGDLGLEVRGFVDDDPQKKGKVIQGIKVLGTTRDLGRLVSALAIDHVIITIAQASRRDIRRIVEICERIPVKVRIIPGYFEILDGRVQVAQVRDVEIEDLLGRDSVELDDALIGEFLRGRTVMVTGAGGSIGSELARQIMRHGPARLLLVERAEGALFDIDRELRRFDRDVDVVPLVADVCDEGRMRMIMARYAPSVVFHAAAHKHVPLMEANPVEAVKNNVLGSWVAARLAGEYGCGAFVLVSTDKAVRPTSIMGATKRVAELVVQRLNAQFQTRYVAVRFGNVLGSAGSVIPIFREQIRRGGPVTVTHPHMVRYFMMIPEAAQLVLQAGAMGEGGEIFILDMGEPVRILDLAKDMITLSGFKPFEDIDIVFTGIRPGEKLFEELETDGEYISKTRHSKIFVGKLAEHPAEVVDEAIRTLRDLAAEGQEERLRAYLAALLPESRLTEPADRSSEAPADRPPSTTEDGPAPGHR